jgi:hypothetical protein
VIALDDFQALRRKVEKAQTKKAEADGREQQIRKQLLEEFKCKSVQEAKATLLQLQTDEEVIGAEYLAKKEAFLEKWQKVLEALDD